MNILMVCLGNICRSPLAEGIMKTKVPAGFLIDSAGTISLHEGKHPDKRAVETAAQHGIDISKQRSRPIIAADFEKFDKIYCMDIDVMATWCQKPEPKNRGKRFLFSWKFWEIMKMRKFRTRTGAEPMNSSMSFSFWKPAAAKLPHSFYRN